MRHFIASKDILVYLFLFIRSERHVMIIYFCCCLISNVVCANTFDSPAIQSFPLNYLKISPLDLFLNIINWEHINSLRLVPDNSPMAIHVTSGYGRITASFSSL